MQSIASLPRYKLVQERGENINIGDRSEMMFGGHVSL